MLVIFFSDFTIKNDSYIPAQKSVTDMKSWGNIQVYLEFKAVFSLEDFKAMWKSFYGLCKKGRNCLLLLLTAQYCFSFIHFMNEK